MEEIKIASGIVTVSLAVLITETEEGVGTTNAQATTVMFCLLRWEKCNSEINTQRKLNKMIARMHVVIFLLALTSVSSWQIKIAYLVCKRTCNIILRINIISDPFYVQQVFRWRVVRRDCALRPQSVTILMTVNHCVKHYKTKVRLILNWEEGGFVFVVLELFNLWPGNTSSRR